MLQTSNVWAERERNMKLSKILAVAGLASACAFTLTSANAVELDAVAQANAPARALKDVMSDMAPLAKEISRQIQDEAKNADSAEKTGKLRVLTLEGLPLVPEVIAGKPDGAAKRVELLEYQKFMSSLYGVLATLEQNFLKNENNVAAQTFAQVRELQKQGHDKFRAKTKKGDSGGQP